jgi:hypothetical protein
MTALQTDKSVVDPEITKKGEGALQKRGDLRNNKVFLCLKSSVTLDGRLWAKGGGGDGGTEID